MGIIDLNITEPTWKHVDRTESENADEKPGLTASEESPASETKSGGRLRRTGRITAGLAAGTISVLALRKLRNRRKKSRQIDTVAE